MWHSSSRHATLLSIETFYDVHAQVIRAIVPNSNSGAIRGNLHCCKGQVDIAYPTHHTHMALSRMPSSSSFLEWQPVLWKLAA